MDNRENDIERIEQFLDNTLSENEKARFEQRLQDDPEFAKRYQLRLKLAHTWQQAAEYEKTKANVKQIIGAERKRRKQLAIYWLAAALVIGVTIPAAIYSTRNNTGRPIAGSESIQLQMNIPEYDATIRFFDDNYRQELPINKQTLRSGGAILFKWNSALDVRTAIVIKRAGADSVAWRVPVLSKMMEYELKKELPGGEYTWEMEGFEGTRTFIIKKPEE